MNKWLQWLLAHHRYSNSARLPSLRICLLISNVVISYVSPTKETTGE